NETGTGTNPNESDCSWEVGDGNVGNAVVGGMDDVAEGLDTSVLGGCVNDAGGHGANYYTCPSGGQTVVGGWDNVAIGSLSSIVGGYANQTNALQSAILGGYGDLLNPPKTNYSQAGATEVAP